MGDSLQKLKGIVVSSKANYLNVDIDRLEGKNFSKFIGKNSRIRLLCTQRNKLKFIGSKVNVGDEVLVEAIDWKLKRGVICKVENRTNFIDRPPVSNVSNIFVLLSVSEPAFSFNQASRFLITAEKTGLDVILVLTKIDLIPSFELKKLISTLKTWFYNPIGISIKTGKGIEVLITKLKTSKISVLCGPSGVGKTSLINSLIPAQSLLIAPVSTKLKRGRHTTRNVELFDLDNGSFIADTPGFNKPEIEIHPSKLADLFPEFRSQERIKSCKFRDCLHRDEPGCLMDKNWQRYSLYCECVEEMISLQNQGQGG